MAFDPAKLEAAKQEASGFDPAKLEAARKKKPSQVTITETPETGMPSAGDFDFGTSAKQTAGHIYDHYIQGQILPLAASIGATFIPGVSAVTKGRAIISPLVEGAYQGTAGYLADKANQALDISPPGEDQAIAQGGIQGLTAMAQKAYRILKPWHGRPGAVRANEAAETEARQTIQQHVPQVAAENLFKEAAKENVRVPMHETEAFVRAKVNAMLQHDKTANLTNLESKLNQAYGPAGAHIYKLWHGIQNDHTMPADTWQWHHMRLGADIGGMRDNAPGSPEAKGLYGAMLTDLERAAERETAPQNAGVTTGGTYDMTPPRPETAGGIADTKTPAIVPKGGGELGPPGTGSTGAAVPGPQSLGATKLLQALRTYRKEAAVGRLQKLVEDAMSIQRGQHGDASFNAAKVIRDLKKDRIFTKAFNPAEQKEITELMYTLNTAPALPVPRSVNAGSKHVVDRAVATAMGQSIGGAAGALAGWSLKDVGDLAGNIGFAMSTKAGREMIKELSKSKGGLLNHRALSVLAAYTTAMKNQPTEFGDEN